MVFQGMDHMVIMADEDIDDFTDGVPQDETEEEE